MRSRRVYWDRYDGEPFVPERGDLVFGPVALYEVLESRPVESATHPDRWLVTMRRIGNNGPDMLDELQARPGRRAHGTKILNTDRLHRERGAQTATGTAAPAQPVRYDPE